jgi:hypothetical protein
MRLRAVPSYGAAVLLCALNSNAAPVAPPARVHVQAEKNTIGIGETTTLFVRLLDAAYRPTVSDRKRLVQLSIRSDERIGRLDPPRIVIDRGAMQAAATFRAMARGRFTIRATSAGLAPSQTLVSVFPRVKGSFAAFALPVVRAASPIRVEFAPKSTPPIPANNKTPADLHVLLDRVLEKNETALIRVTASGPARIAYKDRSEIGSLDFQLGEGDAQSDDIHVSSSSPGTLVLTATALSSGSSDQMAIEFESPKPDRILLQTDAEVAPQRTLAPLDVRLADQDGVPLTSAPRDHNVLLSADAAVEFEPARVRLGATRPRAEAVVQWREFPETGMLTVLARDADNELDAGKAMIALQTRAVQVRLSGPLELARKREATLTITLVDKAHQPVQSDRARTILLSADRGDISPAVLQMARGERLKTVRYTSPVNSGPASIRADSDGLDAGVLKLTVVIAGWVLISFAAFGGIAGALARLVYKERVKRILPHWVNGLLEPGLLVNSLFGGFFGVLVLQAVLLGLLTPMGLREAGSSVAGGPQTLAFFLGSVGGYAGLLALDYLVARLFPERPQELGAAAGAE